MSLYKIFGASWYICILCVLCAKISYTKNIDNQVTLKNIWLEKWGKLPENLTNVATFIFYKYAKDSNGLTSSEFNTLLQCSKGSSECPFSNELELSMKESPYSFLTDCDVNAALSPNLCDILHRCLDGKEMLNHLNLNGTSENDTLVSPDQLGQILPFVLYQAQSQVCIEAEKVKQVASTGKKPTSGEVWGYGILFVTIISGLSLAGVSVIPLMAKDFYQKLLTVLIGLAVGSLASSAAFHLIPQAFGLTNNRDEHHEYLFISLWILIGIYAFFMIERILKIIIIAKQSSDINHENLPESLSNQAIINGRSKDNHELHNSYGPVLSSSRSGSIDSSCDDANEFVATSGKKMPNLDSSFCSASANTVDLIYKSQEQAIRASFGHEQKTKKLRDPHLEIKFRQGEDSVVKTVAWMIIFGDGFHNFIDGVSIGAAFQQSILTGISISIAVMCEELPHELGDFAVLLNSGMTMKQAVFYNFLSATTCYAGLVLGILLGEFTQNSTYIFALAAGMFLYISLVDMFPEMNETGNKAAEEGTWSVLKVLFLQNIGLFMGVASLFFLAYYQDSINFEK